MACAKVYHPIVDLHDKVCNLIRAMPATRLVQIKLPIEEHRVLKREAKAAGRTISGHVRHALTLRNQTPHTVGVKPIDNNEHQTIVRLFSLFAKTTADLMNGNQQHSKTSTLFGEIERQIAALAGSRQ